MNARSHLRIDPVGRAPATEVIAVQDAKIKPHNDVGIAVGVLDYEAAFSKQHPKTALLVGIEADSCQVIPTGLGAVISEYTPLLFTRTGHDHHSMMDVRQATPD